MMDALKATQEGSIKEIEAAEVEAGEAEGEEGGEEGEEVPGEKAPSEHDDEYEPDKPANPKEEGSKDVAGITGENAGVPALAEKDKKSAKVEEVGDEGEEDINTDGDPATKLHMILKDKLSQEEMKAVGEILADLAGKGPEENLNHQENENEAEPKVKPEGEDEDDAEDEGGESETEKKEVGEAEKVDELKEKKRAAGMDAAIKLAVDAAIKGERASQKAIRDAERAVRPYIGEVPAMSFDSAAAVYRHALTSLGVEGADKVHASALPIILKNLPVPGTDVRAKPAKSLGMDAASVKSFNDMFPSASRITSVF